MAIKRQITRLNKQQDAELLEVARRVSAARAQVAQRIRELGRRAAASTDARERERLYAQIAKINEALAADLDKWAGEMVDRTSLDWRREALDEIKQQTGRAPGLAARFDKTKVKEYLRLIHPDNASSLAAVFTNKMAEQDIRSLRTAFLDVFRQSQFERWTADEIQKELQNHWNDLAGKVEFERFVDRSGKSWDNASYLRMLVRTTTARVAREGYIDTLLEHGDDLAQIKSVGDSCPTCSAWAGVIVSLSGTNPKYPSYQQALAAGMYHPNCVLGDTRVIAPGSVVAMKALYSGEVCHISFASGRKLSVTPNHMLLTDTGFAFAHSLSKGDNVLDCTGVQPCHVVAPDDDKSIPCIADVFDALTVAGQVTSATMPASAEYLHGDGVSCEGDIHVVRSNGLLVDALESAFGEHFCQQALGGVDADPFTLARGSIAALLLERLDAATGSGVGSLRLAQASLWAHLRSAHQSGCAVATDGRTCDQQPVPDCNSATAERLRECILRFPGEVSLDKIISVEIKYFHGFVYDLETTSSLYIANGLVSSNCDCLLERMDATVHKDEVETARKRGAPDLSALDSKRKTQSEVRRAVNESLQAWKATIQTES